MQNTVSLEDMVPGEGYFLNALPKRNLKALVVQTDGCPKELIAQYSPEKIISFQEGVFQDFFTIKGEFSIPLIETASNPTKSYFSWQKGEEGDKFFYYSQLLNMI